MKKFLVKLFVLTPLVGSLFFLGFNNLPKECGENPYVKVCFDLGGVLSRDGCVLPSQAEDSEIVSVSESTLTDIEVDHNTWSIYGNPSFIVSDETYKESGEDVFTDPTKGDLILTVYPTEEVCLLQFGKTQPHTEKFTASFAANDTGAGFRVIAKSYWEKLPVSDGAYQLCWKR